MTLIFYYLVLLGCGDCEYTITAEYIESTCKFDQGFYFQEIKVLSTDSQGIPIEIEVVRTIALSQSEGQYSRSKRIYYYNDNRGYKWNDTKNHSLSSILPVKMEVGKWYKIRGLMFRGNPDRAAYLQLRQNGELIVHGYSESMNW